MEPPPESRRPSLALLAVAALAPMAGEARGQEPAAIDFNRDVKPILARACYPCHGPDAAQREADLRLDTAAGATAARDGGSAVVPGDPGASGLVRRVSAPDAGERMPPAEAKLELSDAQRETLRAWVAAGAPYDDHWAFVPPVQVPLMGEAHPIDELVARQLERQGLRAAPRAAPGTLLRRVTLDLTGLPPTEEERAAFLADPSPAAWARVVERLLASPAFGERWAWPWLDAARYADTNGYQGDRERTMWPWRDWVVRAFNGNLPYDRFVVWQLAGDLLPDATLEQRLATGFLRNHPINGEGGRIPEENRVEYVMDMTETTGTVFLGLTLNCCRCHDHKFDPLGQREYYALSAYFNQTPVDGGGDDPQMAPNLAVPHAAGEAGEEAPVVMVMADLPEPRPTYVLARGNYARHGEEVAPGTPAAFPSPAPGDPADRLGLARWLVSDANPLTARVAVNRFWQELFGVGLVETAEDFGTQGETPPQRELLDWLAVEFRAGGWDVKALLRLIVASETYQRSSRAPAADWERDPRNRWLARGPRFRMPSWMLRDQALAASGLLVPRVGGTPVQPYQPAGVWEEASFGKKVYRQGTGEDLHRRSLYTFWRRIVAPPAFFDNADRQVACVRPRRTNTPLHALYTLDDVAFVEAARVLAERSLGAPATADRERLDVVFRRVLARAASPEEAAILLAALDGSRAGYAADPEAAEALLAVGEAPRDATLDSAEHAAWTALCLAVFNLDEALTKE